MFVVTFAVFVVSLDGLAFAEVVVLAVVSGAVTGDAVVVVIKIVIVVSVVGINVALVD